MHKASKSSSDVESESEDSEPEEQVRKKGRRITVEETGPGKRGQSSKICELHLSDSFNLTAGLMSVFFTL